MIRTRDAVQWLKGEKNKQLDPEKKSHYDSLLHGIVTKHLDNKILPRLEEEVKSFIPLEVEEQLKEHELVKKYLIQERIKILQEVEKLLQKHKMGGKSGKSS